MIQAGIIGGDLGYRLLRRLGRATVAGGGYCSGEGYRGVSKLEALFGKDIWNDIREQTVLDFGCGTGEMAIEMAQHGAEHVVGLDIRQKVLDMAARDAEAAGVSALCSFTTRVDEPVDVAFSVDGFEHYDDPAEVLDLLGRLIRPGGKLFIAFGPPWLHPYGGHLFSIFPWAHLLFTERALLRWRSDFKTDGATHFGEVEGGLNQMSICRFRRLVDASPFDVESIELVPIRRLAPFHNQLTSEFLTSIVRCTLAVPA